MLEKPALRTDIQMVMTLVEGRRMIVFQDPHDLGDQRIAVDAGALPLLQMLDGRHEIRDIQRELMNRSAGRLVPLSDIEDFLGSLDRAFLLNSETFRREIDSLFTAFSRQERQASPTTPIRKNWPVSSRSRKASCPRRNCTRLKSMPSSPPTSTSAWRGTRT
jgi:hypothetical protein